MELSRPAGRVVAVLAPALLNLPFPGAGHVLRGRVGLGLGLLVPALLLLTALLLVGLIGTAAWAGSVRAWLLGGYLLLALGATAGQFLIDRPRLTDPEQIRQLHREIAVAVLADRDAEAVVAAERLARVAGHEPGAWRLLALTADAAGDRARGGVARRRLARLLVDREGQP